MAYHPKIAFTVISAFSSRRQYSSYNTAMSNTIILYDCFVAVNNR